MQDDATDRVYEYIGRYLHEWLRPPLVDEIVEDLHLTPRQMMQVLALLQNEGRVYPDSLRPNASQYV